MVTCGERLTSHNEVGRTLIFPQNQRFLPLSSHLYRWTQSCHPRECQSILGCSHRSSWNKELCNIVSDRNYCAQNSVAGGSCCFHRDRQTPTMLNGKVPLTRVLCGFPAGSRRCSR